MKTDTEFDNLANQVGYGLAVVLFEKRLTDKFFSSLNTGEIISIARHVLNNKRLIKLLGQRVARVDWEIRNLVETYNNSKTPTFLKEQIFSKIEKLTLSSRVWLDIQSLSNSALLSDMACKKALASIVSFEEGQAVFTKAAERHTRKTDEILEMLTHLATTYDDWAWIIAREVSSASLLEKCFSAVNNLTLSYQEWCEKETHLRGGSKVWRRWYILVTKKRSEAALTFNDYKNELDIVSSDFGLPEKQKEAQLEIRKLLKKVKLLARSFSDWYDLYYYADEQDRPSLKRACLSKLRLLAVEAEDYYLLYIILGKRNKAEKESYLTKIRSFNPDHNFWIYTYKPKWCDKNYLDVAEKCLAACSADSEAWLKIFRESGNDEPIRKIALQKLSKSQNTGDYWCGIHIVSRNSKELRSVCENNLLALSAPCSEWKDIMNKYSSTDRYDLSNIIYKKLVESAKTFDDWLYILESPKSPNANTDNKKAIVQLGVLASSLNEYINVCLLSETGSSEYKTARNNISLLRLDFKEWLHVYNTASNDSKNRCDRSGGNPLAELALAKMAP
ncbi:MAG: hypothetical protein WCN88_02525 [Candidatus Falkowbacteria bacterium]